MAISVGDRLPEVNLLQMGANGPEFVALADKVKGRKVVIFALPGAFTPTCDSAHVPSFIRTMDRFAAKGVDEIICVSVNDPYVMNAWGKATGANDAGITMLADAQGTMTQAVGMAFDGVATGLMGRSKRYALFAEDGVVKVFHEELGRGVCEVSGGEAMLAAI